MGTSPCCSESYPSLCSRCTTYIWVFFFSHPNQTNLAVLYTYTGLDALIHASPRPVRQSFLVTTSYLGLPSGRAQCFTPALRPSTHVIANAAAQVTWLRQLFREFYTSFGHITLVNYDNINTVYMSIKRTSFSIGARCIWR